MLGQSVAHQDDTREGGKAGWRASERVIRCHDAKGDSYHVKTPVERV